MPIRKLPGVRGKKSPKRSRKNNLWSSYNSENSLSFPLTRETSWYIEYQVTVRRELPQASPTLKAADAAYKV